MTRMHSWALSHDGKKLIVVLSRGNLERNSNDYSLVFFEELDFSHSPKAQVLVTFASSSNREGIHDVKWLNDDETIAFLGENPGEVSQVHLFNITHRHLEQFSNSVTPISSFDITPDGSEIIFLAERQTEKKIHADEVRRNGIVVNDESVDDLLAGDCARPPSDLEIFLQKRGRTAQAIPSQDAIFPWAAPPSLSPDGRYALITTFVRKIPKSWQFYQAAEVRAQIRASRQDIGGPAPIVMRNLLLDTVRLDLGPLLDVPVVGGVGVRWTSDGNGVLLRGTYLPLEEVRAVERQARLKNRYDVEVRLPDRELRNICPANSTKQERVKPELEVTVEQDSNTPPKVYLTRPKTHEHLLLLDLNPQFKELSLGKVETIELRVRGVDLFGGLYLPPDYKSGKRYPLVIQTHGFDRFEFSMDGRSEWNSGYAARPLAAKGIVVLQTFWPKTGKDHDRIGQDRRLGRTAEQSARNLSVLAYDQAIEYLNERGIIDPHHVGITGFSRTVCFVAYSLTHSVHRFSAASLVDGIDCGYLQYISTPRIASDGEALNGGVPPFGKGLAQWKRESPGFNLDRVTAAVRLEAHGESGGILSQWEWFAGLSLLHKPVEYFYLPDAAHQLVKPWERVAAQNGLIDWFVFWLKGEEDPNPAKADQYVRWRAMRRVQGPSD
jgi:dipeptidyl aminopeptidase/acylaminoacyl peptidase